MSKPPSVAEKLQVIDKQLRATHDYCLRNGFNDTQIRDAARPLLNFVGTKHQSRRLYYIFPIIVGLLAAVVWLLLSNRWWHACIRILFLQIASISPWTWMGYETNYCVLSNPFYTDSSMDLLPEDCELCEHLTALSRISNVSHQLMTENHLKREIPVIVTDAIKDWPAQHRFTLNFLHQLYSSESSLKMYPPCILSSNIQLRHASVPAILGQAHRKEIFNWYAHWENCERSSVRLVRRFYRRPYFLPPMVETAPTNWIFVSSDYQAKSFKPVHADHRVMWMAQVMGQFKVKLKPRDPCHDVCTTMYAVLKSGETLLWTDFLWEMDYLPLDNSWSIALGAGGEYD